MYKIMISDEKKIIVDCSSVGRENLPFHGIVSNQVHQELPKTFKNRFRIIHVSAQEINAFRKRLRNMVEESLLSDADISLLVLADKIQGKIMTRDQVLGRVATHLGILYDQKRFQKIPQRRCPGCERFRTEKECMICGTTTILVFVKKHRSR